MVKAYLRYIPEDVFGVIASPEANVVCNHFGNNVIASCNEILCVWDASKSTIATEFKVQCKDGDYEFHHHITRIERHTSLPLVAVGYNDGSVRIWDMVLARSGVGESGEAEGRGYGPRDGGVPRNVFHGHKRAVSALAFSKDGHLLASGGSDSDIVVWDLVGNLGLYRLLGHTNAITCLRFLHSPVSDALHVDSTNDRSLADGQLTNLRRLKAQPKYLISASKDTIVKIWDTDMQCCIQTLVDHPNEVSCLCINPQETRLITAGSDGFLRVFEINLGSKNVSQQANVEGENSSGETLHNGLPQSEAKKTPGAKGEEDLSVENPEKGLPFVVSFLGTVARQSAKGRIVSLDIAYDVLHFIQKELREREKNAEKAEQSDVGSHGKPPAKKRRKVKGKVQSEGNDQSAEEQTHLGGQSGMAVKVSQNEEDRRSLDELVKAYNCSKSHSWNSELTDVVDGRGQSGGGGLTGCVVNGAVGVAEDEFLAPDMMCVLVVQTSRKLLEFFTINSLGEAARRKRRRRARKLENLKKRLKELDETKKILENLNEAMKSDGKVSGKKKKRQKSEPEDEAASATAKGEEELKELADKRVLIECQLYALKKEGIDGHLLSASDELTPIRTVTLKDNPISIDYNSKAQKLLISYKSNYIDILFIPLVRIVYDILQSRKEKKRKNEPNIENDTTGNKAGDFFVSFFSKLGGHTHGIRDFESEESSYEDAEEVEHPLRRDESHAMRLESGKWSTADLGKCLDSGYGRPMSIVWQGHPSVIRALAFSHDDSMILSMELNCVKIWNALSRRCIRFFTGCGLALCGIFVAGNAHVIIGTQEGNVLLYHINAAKTRSTCADSAFHSGAVQAIAEHPRHTKFVTVSQDKTLKCFELYEASVKKGSAVESDAVEMRLSATHPLMDGAIDAMFSADGRYIAVALLDSRMQVFYADTFNVFLTLYGHKLPVASLAISTDCTILASGSADKSIKIWGLDFGNIKSSWQAHDAAVARVTFMFDTHYLVSCGRDGIVKIWDTDTKDLCTQLLGHHKAVTALALSQDSDRIVTSGFDGSIRMWQRTSEQYFLEEEREKELESQLEEDALKGSHVAAAQIVPEVTSTRPTRTTIESIRSTESLMKVIDEAFQHWTSMKGHRVVLGEWMRSKALGDSLIPLEAKPAPPAANPQLQGRNPHEHVMWAVSRLPFNDLYEVLLALPFSYAEKLLHFLTEFFEAFQHAKSAGNFVGGADKRAMDVPSLHNSVSYPIEYAGRVVLILVHLHFRLLISSSEHRQLLLRLQQILRPVLNSEYQKLLFCKTSLDFLATQVKTKRPMPI